jgi:hypothetical protein
MHKSRIPRKPAHIDLLAARRRDRYFGLKAKPAKQVSYRRYWRKAREHIALNGLPRRVRRQIVKRWRREDLKRAKQAQV